MAGLVWPTPTGGYPSDFDLPLADHLHERNHHTHWPFVSGQGKRETFNPDIDLRDYDTGYAIDVELPGLADAHSIKVEWVSKREIIISGCIQRPDVPDMGLRRVPHITKDAINGAKEDHENGVEWTPTLMVGERKTGNFHRRFHLPVDMKMANVKARLENGLLTIRAEKLELDQEATGRVQVE
jgi:HSP20 family molecular chaperone IbpA